MRCMLLTILCLSAFFAEAQRFSNEFLSIGVGARAHGMGKTGVAIVNDATAGYWNPAGLARLDHNGWQIAAMHAEWFAGVGKYDYLSGARKLGDKGRAIGISLIRFGIDGIPNTLNLFEEDGSINYDNVVPFSAADYALIAGLGQKLVKNSDKWTAGANFKIIYRNIGPFASAFGFGLDAGIQYKSDKWQIGLSGKDITGTFNAWNINFTEEEKEVLELTNNEIPINSIEVTNPTFILGFARSFELKNDFELLAALDFLTTTDGKRNTLIKTDGFSIAPNLGFELNYKKFVFLRLGTSNFQQDTDIGSDPFWTFDPSLGIGLVFKDLELDYAFTDIGDQRNSTFSHIISLQYKLPQKKTGK